MVRAGGDKHEGSDSRARTRRAARRLRLFGSDSILSYGSITLATCAGGHGTNWNVTQRFVSLTGPDNCWVREQRQRWGGAVFPDLPMTITRSNGTIRLDGAFFDVNYAGTFSGAEVTAAGVGPLDGGGRPCQDGTSFTQMPGVSNLTGSFSADDQRVTLTEVNTYRLTTGETVTYTWGWEGTRRN